MNILFEAWEKTPQAATNLVMAKIGKILIEEARAKGIQFPADFERVESYVDRVIENKSVQGKRLPWVSLADPSYGLNKDGSYNLRNLTANSIASAMLCFSMNDSRRKPRPVRMSISCFLGMLPISFPMKGVV